MQLPVPVPMRDSRRLVVNQLDCDLIAERLRDRALSTPADELAGHAAPAPHPAAVLLPLFQVDGRWRLLLIRRTEHPTDLDSGLDDWAAWCIGSFPG